METSSPSFRPEVPAEVPHPVLAGWGHAILGKDAESGALFLGPWECCSAETISELQEKRITGIVNCTVEYDCVHQDSIDYCRIPVEDIPSANILPYLRGATEFIESHMQASGSVVVHCEMGRSRSSTVVIAYLMRFRNMSRNDAFVWVKRHRISVNPNDGFWEQLLLFEALHDSGRQLQQFEALGKNWAAASYAYFTTCGIAFESLPPTCGEDSEMMLQSVLDYMFYRGIEANDGRWLIALCKAPPFVGTAEVARVMLDRNSAFMENWGSEVSPKALEQLVGALCCVDKLALPGAECGLEVDEAKPAAKRGYSLQEEAARSELG